MEQAASGGVLEAMTHLGAMYLQGKVSEISYDKTVRWIVVLPSEDLLRLRRA